MKGYGIAVVAASLIATAGAARVAAAPTPAAPVLVSASVDKVSIAVSGLNVVTETVSVHLTDPDGICGGCGSSSEDPFFQTPAVVFSNDQIVQLTLTSGSVTNGVWTGAFPITSYRAGHHTLTQVIADGGPILDPNGENVTEVDIVPSDQGINVAFDVTATHAAHISAGVTPSPSTYNRTITWKGRAYFPDTGAPIPNRKLAIGVDTACGVDDLGGNQVTTDPQGYWSYTEKNAGDQIRCVILASTGAPNLFTTPIFADRQFVVTFRQTVSITLATTPVSLGTKVAVTGNVGAPFGTAVLQRMVTGQWVTASTARVRESGRYTLYAQPSAPGNWRYRVVAPAGEGRSEGISKTVILGVF